MQRTIGHLGQDGEAAAAAVEIRVRGRVQGVGFRPTVWRWAHELGLAGEVFNDGEGLLIRVAGRADAVETLCRRAVDNAPALADVHVIEVATWRPQATPADFRIVASRRGRARTEIGADATVCEACRGEIRDPAARRHGYALTNCTDCGPRASIITATPYDRANTTMAAFEMCAACRAEYGDPGDRRFHAEPIACPACGPQVRLVDTGSGIATASGAAAIEAAAGLVREGQCIAVKGIGGYQLACDATNAAAVVRLRAAKRRPSKPFALMARDVAMIRRYAVVSPLEEAALLTREAQIVLLSAAGRPLCARPDNQSLADIAPGLNLLGFMLPATPLHVLMLENLGAPVVLTSGNVSGEPQIIDDGVALERLARIASHVLLHDRPIAMRLDDSVVQVGNGPADAELHVLRRARGYAPAAITLPQGFETAPEVLACGAELKATFCFLKDGAAVLSPHQGDLRDAATLEDYRANIAHLGRLVGAAPEIVACDLHPDYASTRVAEEEAARLGLALARVQHHHAHIASCLAENGHPLEAPAVLAIVLDGTGLGPDAEIWGGEVLIADYRSARRIGRLAPVAMPGGEAAAREPWRNLYAQLAAAIGWPNVARRYGALPVIAALATLPLATVDRMLATGLNAPLASSCGRLFDAVAAACDLAPDRLSYEGEAAMRLEAVAGDARGNLYPFDVITNPQSGLLQLDPARMWQALLDDLARGALPSQISARFHDGLAAGLSNVVARAREQEAGDGRAFSKVALTGGVFQNRKLLEGVSVRLSNAGLEVFNHAIVPANDGGLALGQAVVAAARAIHGEE